MQDCLILNYIEYLKKICQQKHFSIKLVFSIKVQHCNLFQTRKNTKATKKSSNLPKKRETGYEKKKFNIGQKLDSQKACFALRTSRGACRLSTQIKKYFCDTATLEIRGVYSSMNRNQQSNKTRYRQLSQRALQTQVFVRSASKSQELHATTG